MHPPVLGFTCNVEGRVSVRVQLGGFVCLFVCFVAGSAGAAARYRIHLKCGRQPRESLRQRLGYAAIRITAVQQK